jgi:hypothetical protein
MDEAEESGRADMRLRMFGLQIKGYFAVPGCLRGREEYKPSYLLEKKEIEVF